MPNPNIKEKEAEIKLNALRVIVDGITPEKAQERYGWPDEMTSAVRARLRKALGIDEIDTQLEYLGGNSKTIPKVSPSRTTQSKPLAPSFSDSRPLGSGSSQSDNSLLAKSSEGGE